MKVSMRKRTSSRDLVILANVGTARSIMDTVCFGKCRVELFIIESADMYSINLMT